MTHVLATLAKLRKRRSVQERWTEIGRLVSSLTKIVQTASRLDVKTSKTGWQSLQDAATIDAQLDQLIEAIDQEQTRLTVELLTDSLHREMMLKGRSK